MVIKKNKSELSLAVLIVFFVHQSNENTIVEKKNEIRASKALRHYLKLVSRRPDLTFLTNRIKLNISEKFNPRIACSLIPVEIGCHVFTARVVCYFL